MFPSDNSHNFSVTLTVFVLPSTGSYKLLRAFKGSRDGRRGDQRPSVTVRQQRVCVCNPYQPYNACYCNLMTSKCLKIKISHEIKAHSFQNNDNLVFSISLKITFPKISDINLNKSYKNVLFCPLTTSVLLIIVLITYFLMVFIFLRSLKCRFPK